MENAGPASGYVPIYVKIVLIPGWWYCKKGASEQSEKFACLLACTGPALTESVITPFGHLRHIAMPVL
jgi:hypothetical protein